MADKDLLIFEQNCQEFRSLNGFLAGTYHRDDAEWRTWYSVASLDLEQMAQRGVLWFATFANIVMIFGLWRLRSLMEGLLTSIRTFQGTTSPGRARLIQYLFQTLLFWAAAGALVAGLDPPRYFTRSTKAAPAVHAATGCAAKAASTS